MKRSLERWLEGIRMENFDDLRALLISAEGTCSGVVGRRVFNIDFVIHCDVARM